MPPSLSEHVDITGLTTLRTAAKARYFFDLKALSDIAVLREIYHWALTEHLSVLFIGGGSNMLLACDEYQGVVIKNSLKGLTITSRENGHLIDCGSGELTTVVATTLFTQHASSALVPWVGLPGTIGGGTVGNAGCFGLEWSQVFVSCEAVNLMTGEKKTLFREDLQYRYRHSVLKDDGQKHLFVTQVTLDTSLTDWLKNPYAQMTPKDLLAARREKQPQGFSCGSFFANPPGYFVGKLIQDASLRGTRIGGAQIADTHGNFFLNVESASWRDIIALRDLAKKRVREDRALELTEEVRIIS